MKYIVSFVSLVIVVSFLFLVGYVVLIFGKGIIHQLSILSDYHVALISIFTLILSFLTLIIASAIKSGNKRDQYIHPEKAIVYTRFIELWGEKINEERARENILELHRAFLLWSDKNVLREFIKLKAMIDELSPKNPRILNQVEKVILTMRKDVGEDSFGVKPGELLSLLKIPDSMKPLKSTAHEKEIA